MLWKSTKVDANVSNDRIRKRKKPKKATDDSDTRTETENAFYISKDRAQTIGCYLC